jgi:hypothetical protein
MSTGVIARTVDSGAPSVRKSAPPGQLDSSTWSSLPPRPASLIHSARPASHDSARARVRTSSAGTESANVRSPLITSPLGLRGCNHPNVSALRARIRAAGRQYRRGANRPQGWAIWGAEPKRPPLPVVAKRSESYEPQGRGVGWPRSVLRSRPAFERRWAALGRPVALRRTGTGRKTRARGPRAGRFIGVAINLVLRPSSTCGPPPKFRC